MRACAAALFLSLRAAFLLARSFILFIIAYILVKIRQVLSCNGLTSWFFRNPAAQATGSRSRSSASLRSSASRSSFSRCFSLRAFIRASQPAFNSFCFRFSLSWSSSSFGVFSEAHMGGVVFSYLCVRDIHQGEIRGLVLVQNMSVRNRYHSIFYRFIVAVFLLALL